LAATAPAPSYPLTNTTTNEKTPTPPSGHTHFDFFLLHLLLSCHAIRILFKNLPYTTHTTLLEAQFLATISYYVSELRPGVSIDLVKGREKVDTGKDWGYIRRQCFESEVGNEVANGGNYVRGIHLPKSLRKPNVRVELMVALRVLREAEMEYGFKDGLYLSTALMIVEQMNGIVPE
jgi:Questin oxidase-like